MCATIGVRAFSGRRLRIASWLSRWCRQTSSFSRRPAERARLTSASAAPIP
jgi:hypothetical protein